MGSFSYDTWLQKINTGKVYSSIFSTIFAHIEALLMHIQAYSRHIWHPVQPSHIHNLAIFQILACSKPCEPLTRHIQNLEQFIAFAETWYN